MYRSTAAARDAVLYARIEKDLKHFRLDVEFSCAPGSLLAVVGPSGAGKTTIIRAIAGLERIDGGVIRWGGETWDDVDAGVHVPVRERGVGYVFQEFTLFPHLSIYRNAAYAARDGKRVEELLRMFDIWHIRDSKPHRVSGGERQRCAICQVLARDARVLLMDEPFSALDAPNRRKLGELLRVVKRETPIPIIHVTHDIGEARLLGDEILPVVAGRVEPKWILPFLLPLGDLGGAVCRRGGAEGRPDEQGEVELPVPRREYCL
ncbi:MAG TPA: ATP-binding cassette domain-containing protein [Syntrophales bacterium]|nr:ATP-binding cassette domain-containing protein [Syntrophales bacterium]HOM07785.1 ATP-binding cassette domain-containing protein [Syntrophales bacterium]HOO00493.1 ATP-binding cassette domain-containing protein [Syntrophales bacterium]HPC01796.1 ATP-binding cassette domain-containing protein [Syntrophales bacterium]HPQ07277.1 ATP-binding cassette domain-containing protein [Syntrophales bacterium]